MPSSITSPRPSRPSTPEPVSSPSHPPSPESKGLTMIERIKRRRSGRKGANAKRKANRATSSSSSSSSSSANVDSNSKGADNTPSTPTSSQRRTTLPNVYEDSDGGVESEADIDMATTPLNLGRKRRFSDSTASRSSSRSPSPSPAKKPHRSTKSAVASKRKVIDSDDESDKENSQPSKKQKGANKGDANEPDLQYSPNEVEVETEKGTLKLKEPKAATKTANNGNDSDSEYEPEPKTPVRKTKTKAKTQKTQKTPAPKKGNKRSTKTSDLEKAASPEKVYKVFKPKTPPPKTAKQLAVIEKQAEIREAYFRLPKEYRETKWLADEVDLFCLEKGIGFFEDIELEQQLRLLKEVRKRVDYVNLLNMQKSATSAKNRQVNRWEKLIAQGLYSSSGKLVHEKNLSERQRELNDATRAVDAWEAKDGNITYAVAFNAKYKARAKKYGIHDSHGPEMEDRRDQFFAGDLPVEAWEKRVSDNDATSRESSDSSGVQAREKRLAAAKSGKKPAAPEPVAAAAEVDDRSPFGRVPPATAIKLCPFIFKGIARVEVVWKGSNDSKGGSSKPKLTVKAFDANNKIIDADDSDEEFGQAWSTYVLRSLESLVGAKMGSLDRTFLAILTNSKTNALLERVKRKIGEKYGLDKEMQSSNWLSVAINEFEPLELPVELLKAMTALTDPRKGSAS